MTTRSPTIRSRALPALLVSLLLGFTWLTASAQETKRAFDIPAGKAETTLKTFANQAATQFFYSTDKVGGVRTNAVKGEMAPTEALEAMLARTELVAVRDEKTGALTINRAAAPNAPRVGLEKSSDRPKDRSEAIRKDGTVILDTFEVTGSRIRGMRGAETVQPVITYTRHDLDRIGAQTFDDLWRYVPQLPPTDWANRLETASPAESNAGLVTVGAGLRNLGNNTTLVLVNGRRVPKLGQGYNPNGGTYSLSGIPLSAVERVEILTDGASAIYGADALGGVVNIVLRNDYRGSEITSSYRNSFETDVADRRVGFYSGFGKDRFRFNLSGTWAKTNSLAPRDRPWSASSDRRALGGTDSRSTTPGGPGVVRTIDGSNLPGLNAPVAAIPVNSTGLNLTVADYANAGPLPDRWDTAKDQEFGHTDSRSMRLTVECSFKPWLELFAEGSASRTRSVTPLLPPAFTTTSALVANTSAIVLPAGYPGNPFGIPLKVERVFWEMSDVQSVADIATGDYKWIVGIRGILPHAWRYESAMQRVWSDYRFGTLGATNGGAGLFSSTQLQAAIASSDPALRPILLNNGLLSSPNSPALLATLLSSDGLPTGEMPINWSYDLKADGPVFSLPAGAVKLAIGAELQEDYVDFLPPQLSQGLAGSGPAGMPLNANRTYRPNKRTSRGVFAEAQIPILSESQKIPLMRQLELNASARRENYSDFGSELVPRYGVLWHPFKGMVIRGSYGEGFKVPQLTQLYQTIRVTSNLVGSALAPVYDRQRKDEAITGRIIQATVGGNDKLLPERSRSTNLGAVFKVPGLTSLSLSIDYYEVRHRDRVLGLASPQQLFDYFPDRITRAAPTAAEQAQGFAGAVLGIDRRAINLTYQEVAGFDFELNFNHELGSYGKLQLQVSATKPTKSAIRVAPQEAMFSDLPRQPERGSGSIFWSRGQLEVGAIVTYTGRYSDNYQIGFAGDTIYPALVWDTRVSYAFTRAKSANNGWRRSLLNGLKLDVGLINAFNKTPQIGGLEVQAARRGRPLGSIDPRGRSYQVGFTKSF